MQLIPANPGLVAAFAFKFNGKESRMTERVEAWDADGSAMVVGARGRLITVYEYVNESGCEFEYVGLAEDEDDE
ncbi:hypothetical protein [Nonomuraea ceibae]|uniref:hypothetical protein n=1 Tax=Nonomuraea ceibae TaxID=1935170 RepID=UPI001C601C87|nr:hypothetical protein [Nonomuraea ceibae]